MAFCYGDVGELEIEYDDRYGQPRDLFLAYLTSQIIILI